MIKIKKSAIGIFASIAAMALTSCGKKADVTFWSSFGAKYSNYLDSISKQISNDLGMSIKHESKGSYDGILKQMVYSIGTKKYPSIAVGYPDHFAQYHGSKILASFDDYFSEAEIADYYSDYMPENYIYDTDGKARLYGIPFNKSTELLGYNGVFVEYCASLYPDDDLLNLPQTWEDWAKGKTDPTSKAGRYLSTLHSLVSNHKVIYAQQDDTGHVTAFSETEANGFHKVLDYSSSTLTVDDVRLMSWDATDNAFITLVRQWDSKYTELPSTEYANHPKIRKGNVLFASEDNLPKTIEMLRFFRNMYEDKIFGTPDDLDGRYSSDAFALGRVMFMVCSSGGLSYNTSSFDVRFKVAPIPFKDANHKYVISQGANICLTTNGDPQKASQVVKKLTTGSYQAKWAIETGYFPASKSATQDSEYQAFLAGTDYDNPTVVAYRESANLNENEYVNPAKGWTKFVDDAFIGSSTVREQVKAIIPNCFQNVTNIDDDAQYKSVIKKQLEAIKSSSQKGNINVVSSL